MSDGSSDDEALHETAPQGATSAPTTQLLGWTFVAVQAVLLVLLVVLPSGDDWPRPGWLRTTGTAVVVIGLAAIVVASLRLGAALTPTPVPSGRGSLTTNGAYRFVRHPIYTGVLTIVVGLVVPSGSAVTLAIGLATIAFFNVKARWEEDRLAETYPDYRDYARATPRFVPRPWRRAT